MKLVRYGPVGKERPGLLDADGALRDLSALIDDLAGDHLSDAGLARLRAVDAATLPKVPAAPRFGPPVGGHPRVIAIGLNYADHAAEAGKPVPREPIIFLKGCRPTGAYDPVRLPKGSIKTDWEVELGLVIGTGGLYIPEAQALDHLAGYTIVNDLSEREYQLEREGQWTKGKSFPGFAPVGPWLVTRDEVADPGALGLWLDVNGERRQTGTTATLVFGVAALVAYVSRFFELSPGDIIATGTPPGVGLGLTPPEFLKPGDVVTLGIDGLGEQRQDILAWEG
ncbi:MAG: fumarylacetoacetate hydrolase family protein [Paracoccaceae bacterium]